MKHLTPNLKEYSPRSFERVSIVVICRYFGLLFTNFVVPARVKLSTG